MGGAAWLSRRPYLVKDQEGARNACPASCANSSVRQGIRITPPGHGPRGGRQRRKGRRNLTSTCSLHLLRVLPGSLPGGSHFSVKDYSLTGTSRKEMIYNKEKLLALGGIHQDKIQKWKHKAEEAREQGVTP